MRRLAAIALVLAAFPANAADPPCRAVEVRFTPAAGDMQIAVWIEDAQGKYVDTTYITRLTGQFGLANRPADGLLKTHYRWPYGRREMVLPVWAHRRDHHYPRIVMGGACGNSPETYCPDGSRCNGQCDDATVAYHDRVSSEERFYCAPINGGVIDAMSCASSTYPTLSKGAIADPPAFSLYPPRADVINLNAKTDSPALLSFAGFNDLVAISRATPLANQPLDPAVTWFPTEAIPDGDYVAWIEMSRESDFNASHNYPSHADPVTIWDGFGHKFLGQPSIIYRVPFRLSAEGWTALTADYAGYGSWDGSNGTLNPPDDTITKDKEGSGARRLLAVQDGPDTYRAKVVVGGCGPCEAPQTMTDLALTPRATAIAVSFRLPAAGPMPSRLKVRYRQGSTPITDETFDSALAAPDQPMPSTPGATISATVTDLAPETPYTIAVRGYSGCNKPSPVLSASATTTQQKFVTLNGCFVATAAYGTPSAPVVAGLRKFRDQRLLTTPAGRLFVAGYYAFSPPLANAIAADKRLRAAARAVIDPLAAILNVP